MQHGSLIDGEFVEGAVGLFDVINPADETLVAHVGSCTVPQIEAATQAARRAFDDTVGLDGSCRPSRLRQ
jgi:acyl-CoA reductase-like NAD-dependent aldehyde dehydrogenase